VQSTSLTNYIDLQYYGTLMLGSNQQAMTALFDTGSNICWMATKNCTDCTNAGGITWDYEDSTSYVNETTEGSISYVSGSVSGFYNKDYACITSTKCTSKDF